MRIKIRIRIGEMGLVPADQKQKSVNEIPTVMPNQMNLGSSPAILEDREGCEKSPQEPT